MAIIAPSILSADFGHLSKDVKMINSSSADWFHIDIMDGVFVPNISFGFPVLKAIAKESNKPLDVHLMIEQPERYVEQFAQCGANIISVHYEASLHLHRTIMLLKDLGVKAGVALNPHTPVSLLSEIIADIDLVLLMSVNPGFGGQQFIENTYTKIKAVKNLAAQQNTTVLVEIDGGVNIENAPKLIQAGADVLVAGNTVFSSENPVQTIAKLKEC